MLKLSSINFRTEVIEAKEPVLVVYYTGCDNNNIILEEAADQIEQSLAGAIKVGWVDIRVCPELAQEYGITKEPAAILFHQGQALAGMLGTPNDGLLKERIEEALGGCH